MKCPRCYSETADDSMFCRECGTNLKFLKSHPEKIIDAELTEDKYNSTEKTIFHEEQSAIVAEDCPTNENNIPNQTASNTYNPNYSEFQNDVLFWLAKQAEHQRKINNILSVFLWWFILIPIILFILSWAGIFSIWSILFH